MFVNRKIKMVKVWSEEDEPSYEAVLQGDYFAITYWAQREYLFDLLHSSLCYDIRRLKIVAILKFCVFSIYVYRRRQQWFELLRMKALRLSHAVCENIVFFMHLLRLIKA